MSPALTVAVIIFVLIFILHMPISLGMLTSGVFYFLVKGADIGSVANHVMNAFYSNYVIIAVPLFIFTANVMNSGKVTEMVFKFANGLAGGRRGALGYVNVIASLIFSGMICSAIADASGLGKMEIDAMKKAGYDDGFSCAITADSATICPIFPPSIPLIIYAMLSGASVGALFLGGTLPALLVCAGLMVYVSVISKIRTLLTPIILLAGIYSGIMTPTEAGAIAGIYAILVSFLAYKAMSLKGLLAIVKATVKDTGAVSLMVGAAAVISYIVAREQIANQLGVFVLSITTNKYLFLMLVNIIILILGMFIDTSTIQLVFVPIQKCFFLSLEEKMQLAKIIIETVSGRIPVIVSGHTSDSIEEQIEELTQMSNVGADAVILVSNRFAKENESSAIFMKNLKNVLNALPQVQFGIYECPYPYRRLLTDEELKWCVNSGRIVFLKDVSCSVEIEKHRAKIVEGSSLKLFNANIKTLLTSLQEGYVGYNGVMGNFHIDLYKRLYNNFNTKPQECEDLQAELTEKSKIETMGSPVNAKYHLTLEGLKIDIFSRRMDKNSFSQSQKDAVHTLHNWEKKQRATLF